MLRIRALGPLAIAALGLVHAPARAQTAPAAAPVSTENHNLAEEQFKKAKSLYQEGRYTEARTALLEARRLDPSAKDLVFNLGVVAEKLLEYDEAIGYLREYKAMDSVTEAEAQRADASIRRIEGARARHPKPTTVVIKAPDTTPAGPPKHGRIDAFTVTGLGVTGAAVATGIVFGVLALSANPASTVETGRGNPYTSVQRDNDRAQTYALVSDIGFGVAIAAAITTGVLYFARTRDPSKKPTQGLVLQPHGAGFTF